MVEPMVARKTWRTLEPVHGMIYFVPEAREAYAALGITGRMGYFASRAAPMGAVSAEVVTATFFNFHPGIVRRAIPDAWSVAAPADLLAARLEAADLALRRAFGDAIDAPELAEAAALARTAAEAAVEHLDGRPLFAGHAGLPWPESPHLVLWHAQTLLREFRGDAHVHSLYLYGLSGLDALLTHAASGDVPAEVLRISRAWSPEEWASGIERLQAAGTLAPGSDLAFTEDGRRLREAIEHRTDAASTVAYEALGDDGCARLRDLARPFSRRVIDAGLLSPDPEAWAEG